MSAGRRGQADCCRVHLYRRPRRWHLPATCRRDRQGVRWAIPGAATTTTAPIGEIAASAL